ncbi:WD-40 repeat-containing protein MSI4-like [Trifolium pratense]|uniref:WD-40 repeat-containing protein MSI4-like n=1 Tax=Trifolium pratense TaxID=57577 RepID=A0A2K3LYL7_TRIPR|nr:WD-40 repeat-containing protein MSI4-like [Trifolium pratense]
MNSKKEGGSAASNPLSVEDRYSQWKSHIPVLYDWLANHNLVWPTQSCRWGSLLEEQTYKTRHRLYISEQTDGTVPNTLVIATVELVKPRVAAAEHIAQFNEEARSPFVKKHKTILHPGECMFGIVVTGEYVRIMVTYHDVAETTTSAKSLWTTVILRYPT